MYENIIFSKNEIDNLKKQDMKMSLLIDFVGKIKRDSIPDSFIALVNSVVYQQITFKAAFAIWNRFEKSVKEITPENVYGASFESLRECGLSKTKIEYIKNIAEAIINKEIDIKRFPVMSDEEIIEELVKIKGIGVWTAEMFLIFSLNRKNVMSYSDLALRKGIKWLYDMKKEPTVKEFEKFKKTYSPNNTLASFYLWEITIRNYFKYDNIVKLNYDRTYYDSPIGIIEIQADQNEIISLAFVEDKKHDEKLTSLLLETKIQLNEYFIGTRRKFELPIRTVGTDFQKSVWVELNNCSYGTTSSYKDIAVGIGNEKAVRAIGNANNKNKIAIIIPCHRVIGSDGKLVGYAGELWRKKWLLEHEANNK